jgi:hypothetical protein
MKYALVQVNADNVMLLEALDGGGYAFPAMMAPSASEMVQTLREMLSQVDGTQPVPMSDTKRRDGRAF